MAQFCVYKGNYRKLSQKVCILDKLGLASKRK